MARIRYIKPEFYSDTKLSDLSIVARYFYIGLFCQLDLNGICEDDPKLLKREIFPYDDEITSAKVAQLINELVEKGRLKKLSYDGKDYLFCPKFSKHQNFHKGEKGKHAIPFELLDMTVKIPAPVQHGASTVQAPVQHGASTTGTGTGTGTGTETGIETETVFCAVENVSTQTDHAKVLQLQTQTKPQSFDFEAIYQAYPKRNGNQGKGEGIALLTKRIKTQEQYAELKRGVENYCLHAERTGKYATEFVKQFVTFVRQNLYLEWVNPPDVQQYQRKEQNVAEHNLATYHEWKERQIAGGYGA